MTAWITDEMQMRADPDIVFRTAAEITEWPHLLPHYRSVIHMGTDRQGPIFEMSARRGWIPVKWIAVQWCDATQRRVYYRHIGGPTRGMNVVWRIEAHGDGARVAIDHEMSLLDPLIRTRLGRWIVARCFVHPIARCTLEYLRKYVE